MNQPAVAFKPTSLEDFEALLADCPEDERWELISGRIVRMMVGACWEHNRIIGNIAAGLDQRFRAAGSPCRTLRETFRLKEEGSISSLLPDLLVACRRPAPGATFLHDASILVEVLSGGTARRDREDKWAVYQTLPSLRHYVLVTRDKAHVEVIDRGVSAWSGHRIASGLDDRLLLPEFDIDMTLHEIYADVLD